MLKLTKLSQITSFHSCYIYYSKMKFLNENVLSSRHFALEYLNVLNGKARNCSEKYER